MRLRLQFSILSPIAIQIIQGLDAWFYREVGLGHSRELVTIKHPLIDNVLYREIPLQRHFFISHLSFTPFWWEKFRVIIIWWMYGTFLVIAWFHPVVCTHWLHSRGIWWIHNCDCSKLKWLDGL